MLCVVLCVWMGEGMALVAVACFVLFFESVGRDCSGEERKCGCSVLSSVGPDDTAA